MNAANRSITSGVLILVVSIVLVWQRWPPVQTSDWVIVAFGAAAAVGGSYLLYQALVLRRRR